MSRFFVGQRVKKVRGNNNVGHTGTILAIDQNCPLGLALQIQVDQFCFGFLSGKKVIAPGGIGWGNPKFYEPILDQHTACESEFKESLDKLLSGVSA